MAVNETRAVSPSFVTPSFQPDPVLFIVRLTLVLLPERSSGGEFNSLHLKLQSFTECLMAITQTATLKN